YSAMTTELTDPDYVGTALALQTTIGFLLTVISIQLIPLFVTQIGWSFGFTILAPGPYFGVISLYRLRQQNDSLKIALGRK
ncbi:MAG: MFS transporter, partial [Candidatus Heimdallarchaeota archaeon]